MFGGDREFHARPGCSRILTFFFRDASNCTTIDCTSRQFASNMAFHNFDQAFGEFIDLLKDQ